MAVAGLSLEIIGEEEFDLGPGCLYSRATFITALSLELSASILSPSCLELSAFTFELL